jgi:integrase
VLADVRRGIWKPPEPVQPEPEISKEIPSFEVFAAEWLERRRAEVRESTARDYERALSQHLAPWFGSVRLDQITAQEIDRYKAAKLAEERIGPAQVNKTLTRLAQILGEAVEYELIDRNPATGKRRRVNAPALRHDSIQPEQLPSLLEAADEWLRPVVATLAGAGLRVGEAIALRWRDVNLATGTLRVGQSKSDAGTGREVDLPAGLVQELAEWKARSPKSGPSDRVFVARSYKGQHGPQTKDNVGRRLKPTIRRANVRLSELGIEQISESVSPHDLRRSFAPIRLAAGDDPFRVSEQLAHASTKITTSTYHRAATRRAKLTGSYAEQHDRAMEWARMGGELVGEWQGASQTPSDDPRQSEKSPARGA